MKKLTLIAAVMLILGCDYGPLSDTPVHQLSDYDLCLERDQSMAKRLTTTNPLFLDDSARLFQRTVMLIEERQQRGVQCYSDLVYQQERVT